MFGFKPGYFFGSASFKGTDIGATTWWVFLSNLHVTCKERIFPRLPW